MDERQPVEAQRVQQVVVNFIVRADENEAQAEHAEDDDNMM